MKLPMRATFVLLSLAVCASCMFQAAGPAENSARAAAIAKIDARFAAEKAWEERHAEEYRALRHRYKAGEKVKPQLDALKATQPRFSDLQDEAWVILEANPADDAAFTALKVLMRANFSPENRSKLDTPAYQAQQTRLARVLLDHHLKRENFLNVSYVYLSDGTARIAYWKEVYQRSPHPAVRADAAYRLAKQYAVDSSKPDLTPAARENLRRQVRHYGQIIHDDYADTSAAKEVDYILAGLNDPVGAVLPNVKVSTVTGGVDELANYRGKVVLLDFWATWCPSCRRDHPKLMALKQQLRDSPFEIISVSVDETPALVTQYMAEEHNLPWQQWYVGPEGTLLKQWGIQGFPTYLLIGRDGKLQVRGSTQSLNDIMAHARKLVAQIDSQ